MKNHFFKKLFVLGAAAFLFFSCATTKLSPVYVTNSVKVQLLPVDSIKSEIDDYYLFEGEFGDKILSSIAYLTLSKKEIAVVLLSDLGVTLGEIIYDGESCSINSVVAPKKMKPEYIVLDLQNAFADFKTLKSHYSETKLSLTEEKSGGTTVRKIMSGKETVEEITIDEKSILVKNHLRKYEYRLTKSEE